ncbi:MAG TPA: HTH-type transcriptional activator IlvY [Polyangiaceae bacterium]|nr:HTH-type transcriptional activator IlvY [Polyangiaceae bacterium]
MDFGELRLFLHLSRSLHFGHTSNECHISASALSRAIQRLERDIGHTLFERDNRSVQLTAQGVRFQQFASRVLDERDQLDQALSQESERLRGTISIFATVTACQSFLPDLLSGFRRKYPDIHVRLETGYAVSALSMLDRGDVDIAVAALPERIPQRWVTRIVAYTPLAFVAPVLSCDVSRRVAERAIDWAELPVVLPAQGLARVAVDRWFRQRRVTANVYSEVTGNEAILSLVSTGCAVGVVPRLVMEQSPLSSKVRALEVEPKLGEFRVGLCAAKSRLSDPLVAAFWEATA